MKQEFMSQPIKIQSPIRLKDFNPDFHESMDKEEAREKTHRLTQRIGELQELLHANGRQALLIVLQGMDTSGKDGSAKRVLDFVNPAGVETANFKTPSAEELAHDFLWRVHKALPRYGQIGVFNRSHYEDVLVVRVLKLQPVSVWRPRYDQINAFEKHLSANNIVLLKFFLHISRAEQGERLRERIADPHKNWKFQPEDLKMRAHWAKFQKAYEDAINYCSTYYAPWHVIPANRKWYRDFMIAKIVVKTIEGLKLKWPKPHPELSKFLKLI
jgi:PPK2 family polyphosphate:nucleotide phosphotransferase